VDIFVVAVVGWRWVGGFEDWLVCVRVGLDGSVGGVLVRVQVLCS